MKYLFLLCLIGFSYVLPAREVICLNRSWRFIPGYETRKNVSTEVNLPHMWNQDALSGREDYYRGMGNYEKKVNIPETWAGKKVFIRFKGANTVTNLFVNGRHVGEHRGGYTAFVFELTDYLDYGKENSFWVRVNNAIQLDVMPLLGDFNMYGGIYRDVELIVTGQERISLTDYASSGVYIDQREVSAERALLRVKVLVDGGAGKKVSVRTKILNKERKVVGEQQQEVMLSGGSHQPVIFSFEISRPSLWHGVEDPYLYTLETELVGEGQLKDRVTERFGLRTYEVDPDKGFFLNGTYLKIRGVCRHQDRAEFGNALAPAHHREDMDIMREMGVNAIRLAHYPQDKYVYDLCDETGFVVWAEIPFVGPGGYRDKGFVDQPSFKENGRQQLMELIRQNYNHPSICFWGLFNELKEEGDNPVEYLKELNELAHREDPYRLTVAASNQGGNINRITDLIAWNLYYGWYGGEPAEIGVWADRNHRAYAGKPVGISEYGAGGSIYHQQQALQKPNANSYWHPENWQTHFHEDHWKAIDSRPFLWGTFVWNMFDFGAAHRTEGEIKGKNDKGLVSFDRKERKDAFYFYKANWNKAEKFVYIAERRQNERSKPEQRIKVYSNQPEVELWVNGKSYGKRKGEYGIFIWEGVLLQQGDNLLRVRAGKVPEDEVTIRLK